MKQRPGKYPLRPYHSNTKLSRLIWTKGSLLSKKKVSARKKVRPVFSFVYILWDNDEAVYVGQTTVNIWERVVEHKSSDGHKIAPKIFDSYSFIEVSPSERLDTERYLIDSLQPKYNVVGSNTRIYYPTHRQD